ncbi:hypothetical protein [Polaromonas sp.]|uniref:hypothetical protein n=1 Tax=Polaromonas sp. TaxID=1869339 RepID=UPI00374FE27E
MVFLTIAARANSLLICNIYKGTDLNKRTTFMVTCSLFTALVTGCADKPPGCGDVQVTDRISAAIPRDAVELISNNIRAAGNWKRPGAEKLRTELDTFGKSIKVQVKSIASEGFDPSAKKHSCTADVQITTANGSTESHRMAYTVQGTVDGKDFLLNLSGYSFMLSSMAGGFDIYQMRTSAKAPASSCVEAKMAIARKEIDEVLSRMLKAAEAKGEEYRGLNPVQEEEWQEKSLLKARQECS